MCGSQPQLGELEQEDLCESEATVSKNKTSKEMVNRVIKGPPKEAAFELLPEP